VSLALRGHPRISSSTRKRVLRAAQELGYRPDPQVAKLMHHLRLARSPGFQASIAALTTVPDGEDTAYGAAILRSARSRAEQLGYGFTLFRVADPPKPEPALHRMLRTRGVEGIVLLPIATPRDVSGLLKWSDFSVVTTTYGVLAPQFHRVVPHQFGNALEICRHLAQRGYRRIGLVLPAQQDVRVHHGFSAAVAWQGTIGGTEFVQPCIHDGALPSREQVRAWFAHEKPDAVITSGDVTCAPIVELLGIRPTGRVAFVSASKAERSVFGGIDERPQEIGTAAIEHLATMIQHGEKGPPAVPRVIMIDGRWIDGRSVCRRAAATAGHQLGAPRASISK
jgi:DNA-binding LacI/PurR family transcriptional regulator